MSASIIKKNENKKRCYQFGMASMFYADLSVSSFCYIFTLKFYILLLKNCVMWTCINLHFYLCSEQTI